MNIRNYLFIILFIISIFTYHSTINKNNYKSLLIYKYSNKIDKISLCLFYYLLKLLLAKLTLIIIIFYFQN